MAKIAKRYYKAGATSDLLASWTTEKYTPAQLVRNNLELLRARSREQYANNDYARRFVHLVRSNVVGSEGFNFQARCRLLNGEQDARANEALERHYKRWGRPGNYEVSGRLGMAEFDRLLIQSVVVDGECFIRKVRNREMGEYEYSLQMIDPELIDVRHNVDKAGEPKIRHGIEIDQWDRPVAYYVANRPTSPFQSYSAPRSIERVPADDIIHVYIVERPGQMRGFPWLATPLQRMQMLDGYEEAAVVAARAGASKAIYYELEQESDPRLAGIATGENATTGELSEDIEPGSANVLPPGVSMNAYDPSYPHDQYPEFIKATLRGIASGLGVSYHKLAGDLSDVNFSAGRLGDQEDRELWTTLQNWLIGIYKVPLYEDWLLYTLPMGLLTIDPRGTKSLDREQVEKYRQVSFRGRRWGHIQPREEATANQLKLDYRLTSPQRVMADAGLDADEVLQDWVAWENKLTDLGLQMAEVSSNDGDSEDEQSETPD